MTTVSAEFYSERLVLSDWTEFIQPTGQREEQGPAKKREGARGIDSFETPGGRRFIVIAITTQKVWRDSRRDSATKRSRNQREEKKNCANPPDINE